MKKTTIIFAALGTFLCFIGCHKADITSKAGTFYGNQASLGNGTVRSYVTLNNQGTPVSMGYNFTEGMLDNLPATTTMIMLDPPKEATGSGFEHMELDWNPNGHAPTPIYGFPHFDFHFFLVGMNELMSVTGGPDMAPVDPKYIPTDYYSNVMAVPNMGVHWSDSLSSEFHGMPFTHTFVYGFYHSKMLFVEPMIARSFLQTHTDFTLPVKQPAAFQQAGYNPTTYSVKYDAVKHEYNVSIDSLREHD